MIPASEASSASLSSAIPLRTATSSPPRPAATSSAKAAGITIYITMTANTNSFDIFLFIIFTSSYFNILSPENTEILHPGKRKIQRPIYKYYWKHSGTR